MQSKKSVGLVLLLTLAAFASTNAFAQRNRITRTVNSLDRVQLRGNVSPRMHTDEDQGAVDPSLKLPAVTLVLEQTAEQSAALQQLLADQQNPSSPKYHRWLTPEEFADQFGASAADVAKIRAWVEDNGLTVTAVGRGRNYIAFQGNADQVQRLFGTEIHQFLVNGETHYANTADPQVPSAFQGVVRAVHGLNDFRFRPPSRARNVTERFPIGALPRYNSSSGSHYLAPADVATIYNLKALHDSGITGAGQRVVIVGQTQIRPADLAQFRSTFSMSANVPQTVLVPGTTDPGIVKGDIDEAALDIEWVSAVAPDVTTIYVYAPDVTDALQYAIDQNLAPVLSMSYGLCEQESGQSDAQTLQALARQAVAQGMTWFAASGDDGGADCGTASRFTGAAVDLPAAVPEVTGVGGTTLTEGTGTYWNSSNSSGRGSAISYIPEAGWNDSITGSPASSGGGASLYFTKPSWQSGSGVPSDGARDVPDVAVSASPQHDGYMVYSGGSLAIIGGTSAGAPSFAGIAVLINQYLISTGAQTSAGLGNINPRLYSLAQSAPGIFHDVTSGNNTVTSCTSRRNCTSTPVGFSAGVGYDQVTGLGSVDAYRLATSWTSGTFSTRTASVLLTAGSTTITSADVAVLQATVQGSSSTTPTGTVTFSAGSTTLGVATLIGAGTNASANLTVSASLLSVGTANVTAQYSGDSVYGSASASVTITVQPAYTGPPVVTGIAHGASFRQVFAPGMILSLFGTGLAPVTQSASAVPLPLQLGGVSVTVNGVVAPLYYVSPGQLNIQVPYETAAQQTANVVISNNGQTATTSFVPGAVAPGIFVNGDGAPVPGTSGKAGSLVTLFVTGVGALNPALATGAAPVTGTAVAALPKPGQALAVTVDGVNSTVQFAGNPAGLVGVTQVNYFIPAGAPTGTRSVVVSVGGVASNPVLLSVTP